MKKTLVLSLIAVVVVAGAVGYYLWSKGQPLPEPADTAESAAPEPVAPPPAILYPIEAPPATEAALPALDASDASFGDALVQSLGMGELPAYFYPENMVRRFVVTVDNLPRRKVPANMMPVKPVAGAFMARSAGNKLAIDPANAARYGGYVDALQALDVTRLVDVYIRFYPLFQQAYVDLGYPKGYFNDRLVEAIDDMLSAPDVTTAELVQPSVSYKFADADIEALSAGQKIMIRMGKTNAEQVKAKLRAFRDEVVRRAARS